MEFEKLIQERRSVRSYEKADISLDDIKQIIKAAELAPSWKNSQSWRYYLAYSLESREYVYNLLPDFNKASTANCAFILTTIKKGLSGVRNGVENDLWGAYDLGLSSSYLVLEAKNKGYDTLIMGLHDAEALKEYFKVPDDEIIMALIAIGKRSGDVECKPRRQLDEILKIK